MGEGAGPGSPASPPRLFRSALWTVCAGGVPLAALVASVPVFKRTYGLDGLAAMNLCWAAISYFLVLDFGLGRSVTKVAAARIASAGGAEVGEVLWTALGLVALPGAALAVAGILADAGGLFSGSGFDPGTARHLDAVMPQTLLVALPVTVTGVLRGVLEAYGRFDLAGISRVLAAGATFVVPVAAAAAGATLGGGLWAAAVAHVGVVVAVALLLARVLPPDARGPRGSKRSARELLFQGGWLMVSGLVGPIMVYFDRFVLAARAPLEAVAAYTVPQELITRAAYLAGAVGLVVYPWSSRLSSQGQSQDELLVRGTGLALVFAFPAILVLALFGPEILRFLGGPEVAGPGAVVLRILALGVFANAAVQVAANVLQGAGRPDVMARLHLAELPIYLGLLALAVPRWGLLGAAWVWTLRAVADAVLIGVLLRRLGLLRRIGALRRLAFPLAVGLAVLTAGFLAEPFALRAALAAACTPAFAGWALRNAAAPGTAP